mgnify:CR=1 FL=1
MPLIGMGSNSRGGLTLRPQLQQQLNDLASLCIDVLNLAQKFGKVIIVTNSAPGWLDSSCQAFMPTLHSKIRSYPIYAKPMSYNMTYKLDVFQREIGQYLNLISIGDGIAERTATLRLIGTHGQNGVQRCLKSVKFKDLPTLGQIVEQLEILCLRMENVVNYHGDLDLRSNFTSGGIGAGMGNYRRSGATNSNCAFVHLSHLGERRGPPGGNTASGNHNGNGNGNQQNESQIQTQSQNQSQSQARPSLPSYLQPSSLSLDDDVNSRRGAGMSLSGNLSGNLSGASSTTGSYSGGNGPVTSF